MQEHIENSDKVFMLNMRKNLGSDKNVIDVTHTLQKDRQMVKFIQQWEIKLANLNFSSEQFTQLYREALVKVANKVCAEYVGSLRKKEIKIPL